MSTEAYSLWIFHHWLVNFHLFFVSFLQLSAWTFLKWLQTVFLTTSLVRLKEINKILMRMERCWQDHLHFLLKDKFENKLIDLFVCLLRLPLGPALGIMTTDDAFLVTNWNTFPWEQNLSARIISFADRTTQQNFWLTFYVLIGGRRKNFKLLFMMNIFISLRWYMFISTL